VNRFGTRDTYEREEDEVERLVRPAPKVKPPRHDRRREILTDSEDKDKEVDKDLSLNKKYIGGSTAARVAYRFYIRTAKKDRIKAIRKEDGKTVLISEKTLKEKPGEYDVPEEGLEDAPPGVGPMVAEKARTLLHRAEKDDRIRSYLKDISNPERLGQIPGTKQLPESIAKVLGLRTFGEARDIAKAMGAVHDWDKAHSKEKGLKSKGGPENAEEEEPESKEPPGRKNEHEEAVGSGVIEDEPKPSKTPKGKKPSKGAPQDSPKSPTTDQKAEELDAAWDDISYIHDHKKDFDNYLRSIPSGAEVDGNLLVLDDKTNKLVPYDEVNREQAKRVLDRFKAQVEGKAKAKELHSSLNDVALREQLFQTFAEESKSSPLAKKLKEAEKVLKGLGEAFSEGKIRADRVFPELKGMLPKGIETVADLRAAVKGDPALFHRDLEKEKSEREESDRQRAQKEEEERQERKDQTLHALQVSQEESTVNLLQDIANPSSTAAKALAPEDLTAPAKSKFEYLKHLPEDATVAEVLEAAKKLYPPPPPLKQRPFKKREVVSEIRRIFDVLPPHKMDAATFKAVNAFSKLHPDDIGPAFSMFMAARQADGGRLDTDIAHTRKYYQTDPNQVRPPKHIEENGEQVAFKDLTPDRQAVVMHEHRIRTVALSQAAQARVTDKLHSIGASSSLTNAVSRHLFDDPTKTDWETVTHEAQAAFRSAIEKVPESMESPSAAKKVLRALKEAPAARRVAVGHLQAIDYHKAIEAIEKDRLDERSSTPREIAASIARVCHEVRARSKHYGSDVVEDVPNLVRGRVLQKLDALDPEKAAKVREALQRHLEDDYEQATRLHEEALKAYAETATPYRSLSPPPPPRPPLEMGSSASGKDMVQEHIRRLTGRNGSFYSKDRTMVPVAKKAIYHGVLPYPAGHEGFAPYAPWTQVHQRDLGEKDFDGLVASAKKWLETPFLNHGIEGLPDRSRVQAALDLALKTHGGGRYEASLAPPLYASLLDRLAGTTRKAFDLSATSPYGRSTFDGSARRDEETHTMKAALEIRSFAAKIAAKQPTLAYDLVDLANRVAADEAKDEAKDEKGAGTAPPFEKKKAQQQGEEQQGEEQARAQEKQASAYNTLRAAVIRTASASPGLRQALLPVLQVIKQLG
jgi:hypothetical protein